jgi:hypothetical protein
MKENAGSNSMASPLALLPYSCVLCHSIDMKSSVLRKYVSRSKVCRALPGVLDAVVVLELLSSSGRD